jgi:hypothetical protein
MGNLTLISIKKITQKISHSSQLQPLLVVRMQALFEQPAMLDAPEQFI